MARIHGKHGQVLMDLGGSPGSPVGGSPYAPVAIGDVDAWTLDLSTDRVEVTCFGDTNKQRVTGLPDFSGTIAGQWNKDTTPSLMAVVLGGSPVFLRLVPNRNEATYYFEGLANIDGSINCAANGSVSFAGKWDAAGDWIMNP